MQSAMVILGNKIEAHLNVAPKYVPHCSFLEPIVELDDRGVVTYREDFRKGCSDAVQYVESISSIEETKDEASTSSASTSGVPTLRMCSPDSKTQWNPKLSNVYFNALREMSSEGVSFEGKVALVTGCSKGSIGIKIVSALLQGG